MLYTTYDNIRPADRLARLVVGAALIAVIFSPAFNAYWVSLVSVYPIMTAIMAWDPVYALMENHKSHTPSKSRRLTHTHAPA